MGENPLWFYEWCEKKVLSDPRFNNPLTLVEPGVLKKTDLGLLKQITSRGENLPQSILTVDDPFIQ